MRKGRMRHRRDRRARLDEAFRVDQLLALAFDSDLDVAELAGRELLAHFGVREVQLVDGDRLKVIRRASTAPRKADPWSGSILADRDGWH
jgi:hypothetical protein